MGDGVSHKWQLLRLVKSICVWHCLQQLAQKSCARALGLILRSFCTSRIQYRQYLSVALRFVLFLLVLRLSIHELPLRQSQTCIIRKLRSYTCFYLSAQGRWASATRAGAASLEARRQESDIKTRCFEGCHGCIQGSAERSDGLLSQPRLGKRQDQKKRNREISRQNLSSSWPCHRLGYGDNVDMTSG